MLQQPLNHHQYHQHHLHHNTTTTTTNTTLNSHLAPQLLQQEAGPRVQLNTWCHQCKMRKPRVVCCDNFLAGTSSSSTSRGPRCNGRYCDGCTARHYGEVSVEWCVL